MINDRRWHGDGAYHLPCTRVEWIMHKRSRSHTQNHTTRTIQHTTRQEQHDKRPHEDLPTRTLQLWTHRKMQYRSLSLARLALVKQPPHVRLFVKHRLAPPPNIDTQAEALSLVIFGAAGVDEATPSRTPLRQTWACAISSRAPVHK